MQSFMSLQAELPRRKQAAVVVSVRRRQPAVFVVRRRHQTHPGVFHSAFYQTHPGVFHSAFWLSLLLLLLLSAWQRGDHNNHAVVLVYYVKGQALFNVIRFQNLTNKMEADVRELARAVEEAYAKKCDTDDNVNDTSSSSSPSPSCERANYLDCVSMYPHQECRGGVDYSSPACYNFVNGSSGTCSSFYDFTIS
jgi:hypothetical protein